MIEKGKKKDRSILKKVYKRVYVSAKKGKEDPYWLPDKPEYDAVRSRVVEMVDYARSVAFEEIETTGYDGIRLYGRLYRGREDAPVMIAFHGYMSAAFRDCGLSVRLRDTRGFNAIVIDQRGQGKSGGENITFGAKESRDAISWCNYAKELFGENVQIGLCGVSMGASTIILAAQRDDFPKNVKGIFADCPFSSGEAIIKNQIHQMKLPVGICYHAVKKAGEKYGDVHMAETDCVKNISRIQVPMYLVHGENDNFVPCEMSRIIQRANPEMITLSTYPGAEHGLSYMVDSARYEKENLGFWTSVFDNCQ